MLDLFYSWDSVSNWSEIVNDTFNSVKIDSESYQVIVVFQTI